MMFADEGLPSSWIGVAALLVSTVVGFAQWWIRYRTNGKIEALKAAAVKADHNKQILRGILARFTTVAIIEIDDKGRVTQWDSGARAIFGYTFEEMKGQPLSRIMSLSRRSGHHAAVANAAKEKRVIHNRILEDTARKKGSATEFKIRIKINADVCEDGAWSAIAEIQDIDVKWEAFDRDDDAPIITSSDSSSGLKNGD